MQTKGVGVVIISVCGVSGIERNLRVSGFGTAFVLLDEVLEAKQKCRPLGAAVVHELVGLTPAFVAEQDHSLAITPFETKGDLSGDPIFCRAGITPFHEARIGMDHLQPVLAELKGAALARVAIGVRGPPAANTFDGCERIKNPHGFSGDTDAVKNVWHSKSPCFWDASPRCA
jgi:hypothetical protein